jgi:hypothetical protein
MISVCFRFIIIFIWCFTKDFGERRTTFAKAYGIEVRCYWELFEEHVRNLGTLCFESPSQKKKRKKKLGWKVECPSGK